MKSTNDLLPALRQIPLSEDTTQPITLRERVESLNNSDRAGRAAEAASAASIASWSVFEATNVDDGINAAYQLAYPNLAADHSLSEHWTRMMDQGPDSMTGFIIGIKGKLAEIELAETLESAGYTNVVIPVDPTTPLWDISALSPDGVEVLFQVKTGAEGYAGQVQALAT